MQKQEDAHLPIMGKHIEERKRPRVLCFGMLWGIIPNGWRMKRLTKLLHRSQLDWNCTMQWWSLKYFICVSIFNNFKIGDSTFLHHSFKVVWSMLLDLTKLYWPSKTFVSFELKSQKTDTYQILTFIFLHDSDYQNHKSKVKKQPL